LITFKYSRLLFIAFATFFLFSEIQTNLFAQESLAQVITLKPGDLIEPDESMILTVQMDVGKEPNSVVSGRDAVLVQALNGLVFTSITTNVAGQTTSSGIVFDQLVVPDKDKFITRFSDYLGKPVTMKLLDEINQEVVRYYRDHDISVVDSFMPQGQDITEGTLHVVVLTGKLDKIRVEGAHYFNEARMVSQLRLKVDETLSTDTMRDDLKWLNNNPYRKVNIVLERGKTTGKTNVVLKVEDRLPVRVYAGVEDSGTRLVDTNRWLTGFNWGNVFGWEHQLAYQYTSSFKYGKLKSHSLNYLAPLPWRHTLTFSGAHSTARPDTTASGFNLSGRSWQLSGRYQIPLDSEKLRQQISFGVDFKRSNNDLEFGSLRVFNNFTNIVQFVADYQAGLEDSLGYTSLETVLNYSPGELGKDNTDQAYNASRAGASSDYFYSHINLDRVTRLPGKFSLVQDLKLQWANTNLLANEQLGVSGYQSVRGYDDYQFTGDRGVVLRNEIRTPSQSIMQLTRHPGYQDSFQLLAFLDYGYIEYVNELPGESGTDLMSAGLGIRYAFEPYISLRADYGIQLKSLLTDSQNDRRLHFNVIIGY